MVAEMTNKKIGEKKSYRWIQMILVGKKPKTDVYHVCNKGTGRILGTIYWYSPWRQYSFSPQSETIFNKECLLNIIDFIERLKNERL